MSDSLSMTQARQVETRSAHTTARELGPSTAPGIERGTTMGRYLVLEELGKGAMGRVVKAYDTRLCREVALKLVRLGAAQDEDAARVMREAQAMATLSHPNVVAVFDVERHSSALLYLAMEYVPGSTMRRWLRDDPRSRDEIVDAFVRAGRGLAAAHEAGLVHRDFKPSNVMIADDGRVKVTDFGLARVAEGWVPTNGDGGEEPLSLELTQHGLVMGTPAYMSPEQHTGRVIDGRSDQYSFCVALYEALCGRRPFRGGGVEQLLELKVFGPPSFPAEASVPSWLQQVVLRGLEPRPEDRWPNMEALLSALRADPAVRRRRVLLAAGLGLTVAAVAGLAARGTETEPCPLATAELGDVWDEDARQRLREAMLATGLSYAGDTWSRVDVGLGRYAEGWLEARRDACMATAVRREQSTEILDRRMLCLDRARSALAVTVRSLTAAGPEAVEHGALAVSELPRLDHCADLERLAELAPPTDPELAAQVEEGYTRIQELELLRVTGRYHRALEELESSLGAIEALEYLPLTALAVFRHSIFLDQVGRYEDAVDAAERSFRLALESRADHLAMDVTGQVEWVLSGRLRRNEEALAWNDTGAALARRLGLPVARIEGSRASVLVGMGEHEEAERLFLRMLPELEREVGRDSESFASQINVLGNLYLDLGRPAEALAQYRRSYDSWVAVLGPSHPHTAGTQLNIGLALSELDQLPQARRQLREALSLWEAAYGPRHPNVAYALLELGRLQIRMDQLDEASESLSRSLQMRELGTGTRAIVAADAMIALAEIAMARRRWSEAEARLTGALEIYEETMPPEHPYLVPMLVDLGEVLQHRGRSDQARARYERAAAIARASLPEDHEDRRRAEDGLVEIGLAVSPDERGEENPEHPEANGVDLR